MSERAIKTKSWPAGVNNIAPDYALPTDQYGKQIHLRAAINIDFLDNGQVRSRKGKQRVYTGATHSFWSDGTTALFVENGVLKRLETNLTGTALRSGLSNARMQYHPINGEIYFSNGIDSGIYRGGSVREWGVENPPSPPTAVSANGLLPNGRYQLICTFVNLYGEESGCMQASAYDVTTGGLTVTLPQPISAEVVKINLYATPPDGDQFYLSAVAAINQTIPLIDEPVYGRTLRTQFCKKMIPGELLEVYRGIVYAAVGNIVWHSEPFNYGLYKPAKNYMPMPAEVTVMGATQNGLYIISDSTRYFAGTGPADFVAQEAAPYGAAKYSAVSMKDGLSVVWRSQRGISRGDDGGGTIVNLQEDRVYPEQVTQGTTLIREQDSLKQIVSVGFSAPYPSGLVASDYWEADVITQRS